ncbi:LytTR family DNA-binding domain-containing protein [Bacillus massiliglaciei]|uniref:LytTR family DNA-binding domain-containing protein n=1 Tax=Bacillus massiliglaciei TaxID=1816693 RepID=UPI000B318C62|nr:LytTR family DNA-binding domain-containing protein [Bacillus massiliglaciei]
MMQKALKTEYSQEPLQLPDLLVGKADGYYKPIEYEDICFIESSLGKVEITTRDTVYTCRQSLADLEMMLPRNLFFRCHRAFIVNVHHIDRIVTKSKEPLTLIMKDKNGSSVTVSQNMVKGFRSYLNF